MQIIDVWHALGLSFKNFFSLLIVSYLILLASDLLIYFKVLAVLIFAQSILIYVKNSKYIVDIESGKFTFPRSDIENSILEILIGARYWNLMRTMTVELSEIENIYIDTKRWSTTRKVYAGSYKNGGVKLKNKTKRHIRYTINVIGDFGGANLSFLSRQKRDEVRNMLQRTVHDVTGRNIDRKIAEFS